MKTWNHTYFQLNDLPDMVLAIIVRLLVSSLLIDSHGLGQFCWDQ